MQLDDIQTNIAVKTTEGSFKNNDGLLVFTRQWSSGLPPKALIFISHGFAEHSGRYSNFLAPALVAEGFLVISHDHVGHGKSEGERAQIDSFDKYVQDIFHHMDKETAKFPSAPVFLFGHSMGGAIAILAGIHRPRFFAGIVLSGPAITADPNTDTKCFRCLGAIIAYIVPSIQVIPAIDPNDTCRNSVKVEEYRSDPLVWHEGIKAGWGIAMTKTMDTIKEKMADIDWPFLVLHGDADSIVMMDGSVQLEKLAKSKDKAIKIYKGYYHELLNEPEECSEIVKNDITEWLRKRLPTN